MAERDKTASDGPTQESKKQGAISIGMCSLSNSEGGSSNFLSLIILYAKKIEAKLDWERQEVCIAREPND